MFGHESLPSRIYSYGTMKLGDFPGRDKAEEQMRLAHRYRNRLVEIELARRRAVEEALRRLSPDLVGCELAIEAQERALEVARSSIRRASAEARKKVASPEARDAAKTAIAHLKRERAKRMSLRKALFSSSDWEAEEKRISDEAGAAIRKARAECGLYWGTYLHVEGTVKRTGAPPRFHRWDGSGHLAVQIQHGMTWAEALAGADNRLRVRHAPPTDSKHSQLLHVVSVRVGSTEDGSPVWADVPRVVLHRPIPDGARIKWVHLIRRRIGCSQKWHVQFVVSAESWERTDRATSGTVGINVGWRMRPDGSLRVAAFCGDDGRRGELCLPSRWLAQWKKTEDIRSIRDRNFDDVRTAIANWVKGTIPEHVRALTGEVMPELPPWWRQRAATLASWKSPARLAALTIHWRANRFAGDAVMFPLVEDWRRRDRHLYEYERHLADQLLAEREDLYRVFAADLRRRYKTAIVMELDLRDFHVLPPAEEPTPDGALREHTRDACLSLLHRCLDESMSEVIRSDPRNVTRMCRECGGLNDWDRKVLHRVCSWCHAERDQDENAARNLRDRTGGGASDKVA